MKKTKVILLLFIGFSLFLLTGCQSETEKETSNLSSVKCTRTGNADGGLKSNMEYNVYYNGEYVKVLHSVEKVTGSDTDTLKKYKEAYEKINKQYDGLEYYDSTVKQTDGQVLRETTINYGKIDIDKLLDIEGTDDNVIEDGKVKLQTWLSFAKKFGAECND